MEDVAIIGAGPAGSTLAALLAGRGISVALYDRDAFPRDKLCGEFLSYDALPVLEPLGVVDEIDKAGAPRIERCRVVGSKRTYEFAFPHAARGVSRFYLDDLLHRVAQQRGARAMVNTVNELPEAKVIVGAWGRWGRFDQQLGRKFVRDRSHRNFGFKRHYRRVEDRQSCLSGTGRIACPPPSNVIDLHSFKRGYLGVNAVEGGITNAARARMYDSPARADSRITRESGTRSSRPFAPRSRGSRSCTRGTSPRRTAISPRSR